MKILLVDDEQGFLTIMGEILRDAGHEVVVASDGKAARELLETEEVGLIISDVFMPTLDGVRFHSYVREFTMNSDVPFIFLSGYDDERTRALIADPTRDFFFPKTTPVEKILALIESLDKAERLPSA
jgi:DNA-binding response OmpR family regulator